MPELLQLASTPRTRIAEVRVAELAARQWGVLKRVQLDDVGLSEAGISRWISERRLHRIYPGVFALGHPAIGLEGRLAAGLLYAGPGAALYGVTAGAWLGLVTAKPRRFHVCTPRRRRSFRDLKVHCKRPVERVWHQGLPITPPARVLLEMASQVRFMELRRGLAEAVFLKLVTLEDAEQELGRGKPGSAALRAAIDCHRPQLAATRSVLEEKLILLCERHSITPPAVNVMIESWLVDAVWFEQHVIVELDGHQAHGSPAALERDHERDLALRAAGYTVLRYTWQQLTETPELVVADLRRALGL